jgi:NADPH-dependent curcumin reductase CurA
MAHGGRISICGSIANYNDTEKQKCIIFQTIFYVIQIDLLLLVPQINMDILMNELTIRGFIVSSFEKEFDKAFNDMVPLVKKVKKLNEELMYLEFWYLLG